ncbi:MAG TPA: VOC family protein [Streptomyces sp.]|nr:VOC family protein [Streptomyces sp.]
MTDARGPGSPSAAEPGRYAPGTPCWVSLTVHAVDATRAFYGALFGWEFRPGPQPLGPYARALVDGREVAGIGRLPEGRRLPVAWTPYLASDDVDATADAVRSYGGTIGVGPLDAADAGRLAIGSDPSGAVFGIWQAAAHLGAAVTGVPGTPAWNELLTYEPARTAKFYAAVFGHEAEAGARGGGDEVTLHVDGRAVAGVSSGGPALGPGRGPHWITSFQVADLDDALERVVALGGRVLVPAGDRARGRVATVADPEGARFSLLCGAG